MESTRTGKGLARLFLKRPLLHNRGFVVTLVENSRWGRLKWGKQEKGQSRKAFLKLLTKVMEYTTKVESCPPPRLFYPANALPAIASTIFSCQYPAARY